LFHTIRKKGAIMKTGLLIVLLVSLSTSAWAKEGKLPRMSVKIEEERVCSLFTKPRFVEDDPEPIRLPYFKVLMDHLGNQKVVCLNVVLIPAFSCAEHEVVRVYTTGDHEPQMSSLGSGKMFFFFHRTIHWLRVAFECTSEESLFPEDGVEDLPAPSDYPPALASRP
jgi:hypothetical protein